MFNELLKEHKKDSIESAIGYDVSTIRKHFKNKIANLVSDIVMYMVLLIIGIAA